MGMSIQTGLDEIKRYLGLIELFFLGPIQKTNNGRLDLLIMDQDRKSRLLFLKNIIKKRPLKDTTRCFIIGPLGLESPSHDVLSKNLVKLSIAYLEMIEPLARNLVRHFNADDTIMVFTDLAMAPSIKESKQVSFSEEDERLYNIAYIQAMRFLATFAKNSSAHVVLFENVQIIGHKKSAQIKRFFKTNESLTITSTRS